MHLHSHIVRVFLNRQIFLGELGVSSRLVGKTPKPGT